MRDPNSLLFGGARLKGCTRHLAGFDGIEGGQEQSTTLRIGVTGTLPAGGDVPGCRLQAAWILRWRACGSGHAGSTPATAGAGAGAPRTRSPPRNTGRLRKHSPWSRIPCAHRDRPTRRIARDLAYNHQDNTAVLRVQRSAMLLLCAHGIVPSSARRRLPPGPPDSQDHIQGAPCEGP
jgi:hypothetical protein